MQQQVVRRSSHLKSAAAQEVKCHQPLIYRVPPRHGCGACSRRVHSLNPSIGRQAFRVCLATSAPVQNEEQTTQESQQGQTPPQETITVQVPITADYVVVATEDELHSMLLQLKDTTCIALDCEGVKLGDKNEGKLTLMQLSARVQTQQGATLKIWIIDVVALQEKAFLSHPADDSNLNLKRILEDTAVEKLLFDVRGDSAQLAADFDIRLKSVYDLQLAETAVRQFKMLPVTYVLPLDKVLGSYLPSTQDLVSDLDHSQRISWTYHASNRTEIWEQRPLSDAMLRYAAIDVRYMHQLEDAFQAQLPPNIIEKVKQASHARMTEGSGRKAEAPLIVRKQDIIKAMQEWKEQAAAGQQQPENGAAVGQDTKDTIKAASLNGNGGNSQQLSSQSQPANSSGQAGRHGNRRQRKGRQKQQDPSRPAANSQTVPLQTVVRTLPQRIDLNKNAVPVGGSTPGKQSLVRPEPAGLLQPRKRAEGEEAPLWIYDSLKPKAENESDSNNENQIEEAGNVSANSENAHTVGGQAQNESNTPVVEEADSKPSKPSFLLWDDPSSSRISKTAAPTQLNRPQLHRPPQRPST